MDEKLECTALLRTPKPKAKSASLRSQFCKSSEATEWCFYAVTAWRLR